MPPLQYRTRLRADVTAALLEIDVFNGHVFNMRSPVLDRSMLPAVRIYTLEDVRTNKSEVHDIGDFDGTLTLRIQVVVEDNADPLVSDRLDYCCYLVEQYLLTDANIRKEIRRIDGISTSIELNVQGEMRTANATLDFAVRYTDCFAVVFPDDLRAIAIALDFIDPPADPNTEGHPTDPAEGGYPGGYPGPDGRIELRFEIDFALAGTSVWDRGGSDWDTSRTFWDLRVSPNSHAQDTPPDLPA